MAYRITGTVLETGAAQTFNSKNGTLYTKRDLVITVRKFDQYTGQSADEVGNTPKFTFMGDKCQRLDGINVGDIVTIHFDIVGRKYEKDGRTEYITDFRPIAVDVMNQPQAYSQPTPPPTAQPFGSQPPQNGFQPFSQPNQSPFPPMPQQAPQADNTGQKKDDLPF